MKTISTNSFCRNMAEQRLMVSAWCDPDEFTRLAEAYGLADTHFEDRLVQSVISYLLVSAERHEEPRLSIFETAVRELCIPYDQSDFHRVFVETTIPRGVGMADLISDVIECADERAERVTAEITTEVLREIYHVQNCQHCRRCINGERPSQPKAKRSWRHVEYAG